MPGWAGSFRSGVHELLDFELARHPGVAEARLGLSHASPRLGLYRALSLLILLLLPTTTITTMATETTTAEASTSSPPKITVIDRVFNIPLVHDSLTSIHSTLAANALTRTPYAVAQAVGGKAYAVSEPIQVRLAPVITRADGLANSAIDVVESRYPYPFKTPTGDIYGDIKKNSDYAYGVANNTIDDRVRKPAYGIAQGIDQVRPSLSLKWLTADDVLSCGFRRLHPW